MNSFIARCAEHVFQAVCLRGFFRPSPFALLGCAFFLLFVYLFCLNYNGILYANAMAYDVMIFLDGVARVKEGAVPHKDFSSGLGLLNFYGPAVLYPLAGSVHQAFLYFVSLVLFVFLVSACYVSWSRLPLLLAIVLLFYIAAMAGSPVELGAHKNTVSHAMYYNRYGWVAMLLAFFLLLKPRIETRFVWIVDVLLAALFLLMALYLKASYFFVIGGFYAIALMLYWHSLYKKGIAVALIVLLVMALIELLWPGIHQAYLKDLETMSQVNGGVGLDFLSALKKNRYYVVLTVIVFFLVRPVYQYQDRYSLWRHTILLCALLMSTLLLFENNAQIEGLPPLLGFVMAAIVLFARGVPDSREKQQTLLWCLLVVLVFVMPEISQKHSSIARYYRDARHADQSFSVHEGLQGLYFSEGSAEVLIGFENEGELDLDRYRYFRSFRHPQQEIYQSEYMFSISRGVEMLENIFLRHGHGSVINFDFSNPFVVALGAQPARGDMLWYHAGRNISRDYHPPAAMLFADARYVAVPKYPAWLESRELLMSLYGDYLSSHYRLVSDGPLWRFFLKDEL